MKKYALFVLVVALIQSCTVNNDIMLKTPKGYEFATFPDSIDPQFKIAINDAVMFRLFANDGFKIIDIVSTGKNNTAFNNRLNVTYLVDFDGTVKLPVLGRVAVNGLTVRQAELLLEEKYLEFYNKPFVQLQVNSRKITVFAGDGGSAKVLPLAANNMTIFEVLAEAGGIARRGNASKVKLIRRNDEGTRDVYFFDLSTIDGLKWGDMVAQADDIIYVQPNPDIARELLQDLTPLISLLTSVVLVFGIVRGLQ